MDKTISEDGMYKVVYKLPSQNVLEFDISFKTNENFECVLFDNFEQEQIPKILLNDINIAFQHFLNEEKRSKSRFNKNQKEAISSKSFLENCVNCWLTIHTFRNHIECNCYVK